MKRLKPEEIVIEALEFIIAYIETVEHVYPEAVEYQDPMVGSRYWALYATKNYAMAHLKAIKAGHVE